MPSNAPQDRIAEYVQGGHARVRGMLQSGSMALIWSLIEAQDDLDVRGDIAEIGVYYGKLFILLSLALRAGERAHGFDTFAFHHETPGANRAALLANLDRFGIGEEARRIHTADTGCVGVEEMAKRLEGRKVRLFSVDGDHSKDGVLHDLALAEAASAPEGVIIADDLFNAWYPAVTEGLFEFLARAGGEWTPVALAAANGPIRTGSSKLFMARPEAAARYASYLRILHAGNFVRLAPLLGTRVAVFDFPDKVYKRPLDDGARGEIARLSGPPAR